MSGHKVDIREPFSSELKIRGNALKLLIFRIYSRLYHQEALEEKSILKLKVTEALWSIIWCLQVISFLWTSNLSIENWEENMIVWNAIGIFRLDNICSQLGTMRECLYLSFTITFMLGVSMTCLAICIYCSLSVAKLFGILRLFFNFWLIFFLIPSMAIYSIFLKYNIWPQKYISEYKENNQEDFEISPGLQFTIVLALITNFPLLYFYNQFTSEIRHSESTKTIKAKAHSKIDCHIAIFTYFLPIFFTLFNESYIIYFQFFMMIVSIIIVAESEMLLPYFSLYYNLMQNLKLFTVAIFSFGFVLGYIMNNSLLIIFIAAILGPISAAILVQLTIKLQKQINLADLADLKEINSEYELEKKLRYWLCLKDTEHKDEIIQIFEKFIIKNNNRGKFQIIWVANYCLYTLKDGPLAKVKLSKAKTISSWNLEADFQEYLLASAILGICNKNINESSSNESLIFINYYQQLNLIKNKDAKLCTHLLNFWEELTSSRPDLNGLKKRLEWINEMILYLNNQYIKLAMEFPGSRECLTLYTSYSNDIIYDYEKSNLLENKLRGLNNLNSANAELKKLSFFNESSGILIISGEPDSFGHILFANPRAAEIMKNSIFSLEESNIMDFIHTYYWKSLKQELKWLIHYGSSSQIEFSKGFFLSIPGRYLIECKGKAVITSIDNNICFILNFQIKQIRHQAALLTDSGEILCWTENFSELAGIYNENLIDCNIKDVFTEIGRYGAEIIFQSQNSQATLVASHIDIYKFKVFYAILRNDHEGIPRWKNENSYNIKKEKEAAYNNSLNQGKSLKTYEISDEKPLKSEMKLIHSNSNVSLVYHENNSVSKSSDARSQFLSKKKFFKMLVIASRSINILHFAFILSIIAVLSTNIIVLFYAFSNINFIKNMDFPMAIAKAESRLQCVAYIAQVLWVQNSYSNSKSDPYLLGFWSATPAYVKELKDIYLDITSSLTKWNYCSSQTILTDKRINVWDSGQIKKESLLNMLSQSIQKGSDLISKFNNSDDFSNEVKFLMMNGYGDGFQYCNSSLYEVIECQKSLMLDFKSEILLLLIMGIGVLGLCFFFMVPFCYSVIKIENDFWNNLRKKAVRNYSEMKQALLERLRSVHSYHEFLYSNRIPSRLIFNFKNYWKFIWRFFIYFIAVIAFSVINIIYLYENCTNYLAYRPEVLLELIRTKILINTLAISASNLQYDVIGFPLNDLLNIHNYQNSLTIFQDSISELRDSIVLLRSPKYQPILSNNFQTIYYENDRQSLPYFNYWDYGAYAAEEEIINTSYMIANIDLSKGDTYWNWVLNLTFLRTNYETFISEADSYSQSVIEGQLNLIVAAFFIFAVISIIIYFALCFVFFKSEKKYLQKINSMMSIMPV